MTSKTQLYTNGYVAYLNSLHNVSANTANALAESQAMNEYFPGIYVPFPIVDHVTELLSSGNDKVVILTGHAGDGKSTVATDVFKQLKGYPLNSPLNHPIKEREDILESNATIVKDMSELSSDTRLEWLTEAFQEQGSWLIVSNTGPLLNSLVQYSDTQQIKLEGSEGIESVILDVLDSPLEDVSNATHRIAGFSKELVILNLTRLDNVRLGSSLLAKLVNHESWSDCNACTSQSECPIWKNKEGIANSLETVEERVRWIYTRVCSYEQRLTLRQIVAHLAFSLTAGKSCSEILQYPSEKLAEPEFQQSVLFSESFFGMSSGSKCHDAQNLQAVSLLSKSYFGAPLGVHFDSSLSRSEGMKWAVVPQSCSHIDSHWRTKLNGKQGIRLRGAHRRLNYIMASHHSELEGEYQLFIDEFLQSPSLRLYDKWKTNGDLGLRKSQRRKLTDLCLKVLLELFTGFSANQYESADRLYLTMRRKDKNIVQPTQLVICSLNFRDFDLTYNVELSLPVLSYQKNKANLDIPMPLFDYILSRSKGKIGSALTPIHQSKIDWFHGELLKAYRAENGDNNDDEVTVIKSGISGEITLHNFIYDADKHVLEVEK